MNDISRILVPDARVTEPGIYNLSHDVYHDDPCPTPSLSAGMINQIIDTPAKCYENSKRLNPLYEEADTADKFTIGTVSHVMFLEPDQFDQRVIVAPYDDWRKNEAKDLRKRALDSGKTAILEKHMDQVRAARAAFLAHSFVKTAFDGGRFEQSMFWRHPIYGFWCRSRPDFIANAGTHLNDYKATASANPENFGRHAYNMGYHRRAAWYLEGCQILFGKRPGHYWFVNQETKKPFLPSVVELDLSAIEDGQAENDHAAAVFARCLETSDWYGYRDSDHTDADRAFRVSLPPWATMEIDRRLGRHRSPWPAPQQFNDEGKAA